MRDKVDRFIVVSSVTCGILLLVVRSSLVPAVVSWATCFMVIGGFLRARQFRIVLFWRTLFLYILNLALGIVFIVDYSRYDGIDDFKVTFSVLMISFSAISATLLYLFPLPTPDPLIGQHKYIGTYSFNFPLNHDCCPASLRGMDKQNNVVTVQMWFPLDPQKFTLWERIKLMFSRKAMLWSSGNPLVEDTECSSLLSYVCKSNNLPPLITSHLPLAYTHSIYTPNLSHILTPSSPMPVAFYSHGMYGWRQITTNVCESLASMGYVCMSCDHTPDCMYTRPAYSSSSSQSTPSMCSDGYKEYGFHVPTDMEDRVFYGQGLKRRLFDIDSLVHFLLYIQCTSTYTRHPQKYTFDLPVYDELKRVCQPLERKIDVYRQLCMWGHSYGGGTVTAYACLHPSPVGGADEQ
ncbi:hypothetical protein EON65_37235, partial [archaeon]